jgi:hypothetical protein
MRENPQLNSNCAGSGFGINGATTSMVINTWYHVAATYDGTTLLAYKNAAQTNSVVNSSGMFNSDGPFMIGSHGISWYFNGLIDEVRVSNTPRSVDWLTTEYNNQNSPATFISVTTEQNQTSMS